MSRRAVVICSALAIVLAGVIGWLFFRLLGDGGRHGRSGVSSDIVNAVPTDALIVYEVKSLSDAEGMLSLSASGIDNFVSVLPEWAESSEAVFSVHKSGKDRLSGLCVLKIPGNVSDKDFVEGIRFRVPDLSESGYNSRKIYSSSRAGFSFALSEGYIVVSGSVNMVETALRHIETGESLMSDVSFADAVTSVSGDAALLIYDKGIGKVISSVFNRTFKKYSFFASSVTDWIAFGINAVDGTVKGSGTCSQLEEASAFSSVFKNQKARSTAVRNILPHNARFCALMRFSDQKKFSEDYNRWRLASKHSSRDVTNAQAWADDAGIEEIVRASIPVGGESADVVFLRCKSELCASEGTDTCLFSNFLTVLFGDYFTAEGGWCAQGPDGWSVCGSRKSVDYVRSLWGNAVFFSMGDYMEQTPLLDVFPKEDTFCAMINFSSFSDDTVSMYFRPEYADIVRKILAKHELNVLTVSMNYDGYSVAPSFSFYSCDLPFTPAPRRIESEKSETVGESEPLLIPEGPFEVTDFRNGAKNTLSQLDNGSLRLTDSKRKVLWTVPFDGKLCGSVVQIDYLKNKKLQMLFASGSCFHLLSRLGKEVPPYPVETGRDILLGPAVFDLNGDRNYTLIALHSDNMLTQYDRDGKRVVGTTDMTAPEQIRTLPELLNAGESSFWVVRTSVQTIVFTKEGLAAAEFRKKKRLAPETEFRATDQEGVFDVTSIDGKVMLLDLNKGSITNNK